MEVWASLLRLLSHDLDLDKWKRMDGWSRERVRPAIRHSHVA